MAYRDFREYLQRLEKEGELKRLSIPFKGGKGKDVTELDSLRYHVAINDGPAVLLENVVDLNTPGIPVVLLAFGSRSPRRLAIALEEKDYKVALQKHIKAMSNCASWPEPVMVDPRKAPCKEVIIKEDQVDFRKQMPFVWFGEERQPYINNGVAITKDPETGIRNVIWNRYGFLYPEDEKGKPFSEEYQRRCLAGYIYWNPPHSDIGRHYRKAVTRGKPLEIAIACNCDPAVHVAGASSPPEGVDEFGLAGELRGSPVELVKCETVDLEVPATAEWVLEGEVLIGPSEMDGPHLHNFGFVNFVKCPVVRIKCITHRKDPVWYGICSCKENFDHGWFFDLGVVSVLLSELRSKIPQVKDIALHPRPQLSGMLVVQLSVDREQRPLGIAQQVIHAVWGAATRYGRQQKYVVVVGPDVDPWNLWDVVWALCTKVQPIRDVITSRGTPRPNDPSAVGFGTEVKVLSEQIGIDATIKIPEQYDTFPWEVVCNPRIMEEVKAKVKDVFKFE